MRAALVFALISCVAPVYHTTFCMPTVRRSVSYLDQVMQSYMKQRVLLMDGVTLAVLDVDNSTSFLLTHQEATQLPDRIKALCDAPDTSGLPSCKVRQQGLDVTAALSHCARFTSGWVVIVEDDCEACAGALDEVVSTLASLDHARIAMAKFSKFTRATAFPIEMVPGYVQSVRDRLYTHPYDITVIEQWAPNRRQYIHARNLFHHVGHVSTEASRNTPEYRAAYTKLRSDTCFQSLF